MVAHKYAILAVLGCFLALSLAGCQAGIAMFAIGAKMTTPDTVTMKPEYEIGGKSVVIIPFRDQAHGYYESGDGVDLATAFAGELLNHKAATNIKSDEAVRREYAGQNIESVGLANIAKTAGTQLVITGDIQTFRLQDPKTIGLLRGYCNVTINIYDAEKNCNVYTLRGMEVWYPEGGGIGSVGIATSDIEPEQFRNALVAATGMKLAQKFYVWEKKIGPEPVRY